MQLFHEIAAGECPLRRTILVLVPCRMLCLWLGMLWPGPLLHGQTPGNIEIDFVEEKTDATIPCRVQILAADGKPQRVRGSLYSRGWNLVEGTLAFRGRPGDYTYRVYHGPQFSAASGGFTLDKRSEGFDVVRLPRHANLEQEGWFGGDLLVVKGDAQPQRWLPAEDLDMAVVVSGAPSPIENGANAAGGWVENASYRDARAGSGLVLHHWMPPATVPESLASSRLLVMAKQASVAADGLPIHAEIQRLWARDVPIWLASGMIDSIQVLSEHLSQDGVGATRVEPLVDPAPGRFRGDQAAGRTVEFLYWRVLEYGLRIPPTAGSAFGANNSPLGYNRVYAFPGSKTPAAWWQAVRDGRTFFTSGPLLRVLINGELPGKVFSVAEGESLALDVELTLTVSDPVDYLDVIFNGKTLYQARLDEHAQRGGRIPLLNVAESGWVVVRVVTQREQTYCIASTAPYYIEVGARPRISREAVQLFQSWLEKAAEQLQRDGGESESSAQVYLDAARNFWKERLEAATAD